MLQIQEAAFIKSSPYFFLLCGRNEYLIFQKIIKLEYEFPEKFFPKAKDLVKQLLVGQPLLSGGVDWKPDVGGVY